MKKTIKKIEGGIVQITTVDERWYLKDESFYPSVTWISSFYPKGVAYFKWLASKGWDEAQAIRQAAGDKGSTVHHAIEDLVNGKEIRMDSKYLNPTTEEMTELTLEEYECIMNYENFFRKYNPKILANETVVFNEKEKYAGTIDQIVQIGEEIWLIDLKTSQYIWPEHEIQISAYKHALENQNCKLAILQLGYKRNKNGWKLTEIEDKFDLFLAAKTIWRSECEKIVPLQKDYPESIKL